MPWKFQFVPGPKKAPEQAPTAVLSPGASPPQSSLAPVVLLREDLEGLPQKVTQSVILQLEAAIRDAHWAMTTHDPTLHHLQCEAVCGKIYGIVEFIRKFRQVTDDEDAKGTP